MATIYLVPTSAPTANPMTAPSYGKACYATTAGCRPQQDSYLHPAYAGTSAFLGLDAAASHRRFHPHGLGHGHGHGGFSFEDELEAALYRQA
ncbi:hypothetical protein OC834_007279, partial [Tilletia horrida]